MRLTQTPLEQVANVVGALLMGCVPWVVLGGADADGAPSRVVDGIAVLAVLTTALTPYVAVRAARCEVVARHGTVLVRGWLRTVRIPARDVVRFSVDADVDFPVLVSVTGGRRRRHVVLLLSMNHRTLPPLRARQLRRRARLRGWIRRNGGLSAQAPPTGRSRRGPDSPP